MEDAFTRTRRRRNKREEGEEESGGESVSVLLEVEGERWRNGMGLGKESLQNM